MHLKPLLLAASGLSAMTAGAALAQDRVVVTGHPLIQAQDDLASSAAVLDGETLVHRRAATLGETLVSIPGVNADNFGGGASRPVVRGQTAPRVKVLSDGAALQDASEVSPDHAVTTEPLLLERIEILRGPAALLYGGGAIGGAVNLIDRKIPTAQPEGGGDAALEVRAGTADDEEAGVLGLTLGTGSPLVMRAEASTLRTNDYQAGAGWTGRVPGTFATTSSAAAGLSWVGTRGYLGAAVSGIDSKYGLPGHSHEYEDCHPHGSTLHCGGHGHDEHDHDHDHDDEDGGAGAGKRAAGPIVDLRSRRFDLRGELEDPFAGVERIRLRAGATDYVHDEADDGVVETTFTNEAWDGRLEVEHSPFGVLRGVVGVQAARSDFGATGAEAFLPESRTDSLALFVLEEVTLGDVRLEGAARGEWQEARAQGRADADHAPFSASAAAVWTFTPGWSAAATLSRSQRAPSAQELYARGVHLATNTFEIGDAALDEETARSIELTLRKTEGDTTFSASVYRYDYDGYIHARTLDQFEDFRLIRYSQDDAAFTGLEAELHHEFGGGFGATVFGDLVRAELDSGANLPRIPAARLGGRLHFLRGAFSGELEYYRVFEQDEIAAFETVTPGYDMVNVTVAYDLPVRPVAAQVFLRGTNLLDELAFNHASFLADRAPLRGGNVVLGVRAAF